MVRKILVASGFCYVLLTSSLHATSAFAWAQGHKTEAYSLCISPLLLTATLLDLSGRFLVKPVYCIPLIAPYLVLYFVDNKDKLRKRR